MNEGQEDEELNLASKNIRDLKFNHCWNYFQAHANQRINLFRFYILYFSLFATGAVFFIVRFPSSSMWHEFSAMFLAVAFAVVTIVFHLLDRRNRELIHYSEDGLKYLENVCFFKKNDKEMLSLFNKEAQNIERGLSKVRHTTCFRIIFILGYIAAGMLFVVSIYSLF